MFFFVNFLQKIQSGELEITLSSFRGANALSLLHLLKQWATSLRKKHLGTVCATPQLMIIHKAKTE